MSLLITPIYITSVVALILCVVVGARYGRLWAKNIGASATKILTLSGLIAIFAAQIYTSSVDIYISDSESFIRFSHNGVMDYAFYSVWVEGLSLVVTFFGILMLSLALIVQLKIRLYKPSA